MPLPEPTSPRRKYHNRKIEAEGFYREDGMWDIEAHMTDIKPYDFTTTDRGMVVSGDPVHDMWIRLTIDNDFMIHEAVAVTDKSPYKMCPNITPNYGALVGLSIGPGFKRKAMVALGGVHGCTHLTELLGTIGTVAYQTAYASREKAFEDFGVEEPPKDPNQPKPRPRHLNSCHAFATDSEVVRDRWPEFYEPRDQD